MAKSQPGRVTRDPELLAFKALNLGDLASWYGYAPDRRESSAASLIMRHPDGDKVAIATAEDGHGVFFSLRTDASGSAVDFVMYREHCTLGRARVSLRAYHPTSHAARPSLPRPRPTSHDRAALVAQWHRFAPYRGGYLESRGLSAATIEATTARLRTDDRGNVVFQHRDREGVAGWEIKNRGFTGYAEGGRKALFAARVGVPAREPPPRLVIAESAIDALSFWQIDPAPALLLSFAGGLSPEQTALVRHVLTTYPAAQVLAATDADAQGDDYAAMIAGIRPDAIRARPTTGKDWNDTLLNRSAKAPRPPSKNTP